ncbi:hypothetical protein Mapa_013700 [Marchantia paleacea]|nr:hypothetical protein Mapa_013700 [Marchantia paleacea]
MNGLSKKKTLREYRSILAESCREVHVLSLSCCVRNVPPESYKIRSLESHEQRQFNRPIYTRSLKRCWVPVDVYVV